MSELIKSLYGDCNDEEKRFFEDCDNVSGDNNDSTDITKAGIWDLCDALSGIDNSKFTVEQAQAEMKRRRI